MPVDGSEALELGPLTVPPGSTAAGWLPLSEDWTRRASGVPLAVIHGGPGPILYLQAVSDGDELNGLAVVRRVWSELQPAALHGAVVLAMVANPEAFRAGTTCDPRDQRKLNRCFPGQPDGTPTERLAYVLFHELVLRADLVIDLHQNGHTPMIPEVRVRTGRRGPEHAACLELAVAFGLPHILDQQGPAGQLARAAPAAGIPTIDPELGGNPGIDPAMVELGYQGVQNVLRHHGMLAGEPRVAQPYIARALLSLHAPAGGLAEFTVALGDRVLAGQTVATITDVFGHRPVPVNAPSDGVFWSHRTEPLVERGVVLGTLGLSSDG